MELMELTLPTSANAKDYVEKTVDARDRREDVLLSVTVIVVHKMYKNKTGICGWNITHYTKEWYKSHSLDVLKEPVWYGINFIRKNSGCQMVMPTGSQRPQPLTPRFFAN